MSTQLLTSGTSPRDLERSLTNISFFLLANARQADPRPLADNFQHLSVLLHLLQRKQRLEAIFRFLEHLPPKDRFKETLNVCGRMEALLMKE